MGTKDDEYDMAVWCFGQDTWNGFLFNEKDSIDLLQAWNKRHGDLLLLHEYDAVSNSMARMKEFWRQYKDGKLESDAGIFSVSRINKLPRHLKMHNEKCAAR